MIVTGTQLLIEGWPVVLPSLLACAVMLLTATVVLTRSPLADIPLVGAELGGEQKRKQAYIDSAKDLYREGYRKFRDSVFEITTSAKPRTIVVPRKYLDELRRLPVDVLSFLGATSDTFHGAYTDVAPADEKLTGPNIMPFLALPTVIKTALTPALTRLTPVLNATIDEVLSLEMPSCDDWTAVKIMPALQRMVALISGRVFIGPELCRNETYIHASIHYTIEVMRTLDAINRVPKWRRAWSVPRLPEIQELERYREQAHAFLRPVVEARKTMMDVKPDDMLSWMMDWVDKHGRGDDSTRTLARMQLLLSFSAIFTTSITAGNAFHTLAVMPDVAAELRAEARAVLAEHDGVFTAAAVKGMKKLDSFLKEVLRCHHVLATTFNRKVVKPFTLSDGTSFPAGVIIEAVGLGTLFDSDFEKAEQFDAFRFYRLRERQRQAAGQAQFVSVTQSSLAFGYGRHACPGRFFAATELKLLVAKMLLRYDVRTEDGRKERYPNVDKGLSSQPDPERVLMFKKIGDESL